MEVSEPNPFKAWLGDPAWNDILALCELPAFKDFKQSFKANSAKWEDVMNVNTPFESVNALAGDTMDTFKKLCVLRCIRPDAVVRYFSEAHNLSVSDAIPLLTID
jgi:dynein heavy chain, axonemal